MIPPADASGCSNSSSNYKTSNYMHSALLQPFVCLPVLCYATVKKIHFPCTWRRKTYMQNLKVDTNASPFIYPFMWTPAGAACVRGTWPWPTAPQLSPPRLFSQPALTLADGFLPGQTRPNAAALLRNSTLLKLIKTKGSLASVLP